MKVGGFGLESTRHRLIFSSRDGSRTEKVIRMRMHWADLSTAASNLLAAREGKPPLLEFMRDPLLTVACVLLVVVSVGWVVVTRLIVHRMKRAAIRGVRSAATETIRPAKDIWSIPP